MVTSLYMPDVQVEIAFDSGFSTPAVDRTWTDVSDYVELAEGISIDFGRQDERSTADANQLTLTLDNRDGRFTAERAASPYYPNVKLDRPIRVTATPVDGPASVRFLGYINAWPTEWDGTDAYAKTTISASSRLSRLGLRAQWRSIVEETFLSAGPLAYYTLGEPEGSTSAADSSGAAYGSLAVISGTAFGSATGPGTDDLTAASFTNGLGLQHKAGSSSTVGTFEFFMNASAVNQSVLNASLGGSPTGFDVATSVSIDIDFSGNPIITNGFGGTVFATGTSDVADGATHHLAAVLDGSTVRLYVDGVEEDNVAQTVATPWDIDTIRAGWSFTGVLAHVAFYSTALDAATIAEHASVGLDGFAGETTDERLERYAELAGIAAAEVAAEAGSTTMVHVDSTGSQVVDLMRKVEATEGGVLFDARDGTLTLHNRSHRYAATSSFTLNMAAQHVESDYAPTMDRTFLLNDVTASNVAGNVTARVVDAASVADYSPVTDSIETASDDADEPLQAAAWRVAAYAEPKPRVPSLSVDLLGQVGETPDSADVAAATVGAVITVSNQPTQAPATSTTYFVEGATETFGLESWRITFNLSPTSPTLNTLLLDSGTRGLLGTNVLAY